MDSGGIADTDARIGTAVDKYTIVRLLGRGGMGAVYEARHAHLARRFAVKFLLPPFAAHPEILRRFENEAKAAGGLEHPNLAAVTDVGRAADGAPYLVMEFLEGEDCAHLLRRVGPLPAWRAADIVMQASRGLAVAHRADIVHRDLKPENLFVTDAGDGCDLIKVLDFGIAKLRAADAGVGTKSGATFGTACYMSPEQARGAGDVDQRTDVWSLGVVLYELLSGRKPFEGEQFLEVVHKVLSLEPQPLAELRPGLAPGLLAVVERALAKDVGARFATVVALMEALAPFAARAPVAGARAAPAGAVTLPTPATGEASSPSDFSVMAGQSALSSPPPARRARTKVLAATVVVAAAGLVAVMGARSYEEAPRVTSAAAPGVARPPVRPADATAPAALPDAGRPSVKTPDVPGVSEQFEHGPNKPKDRRPAPRPRREGPAPAPRTPAAAPPAAPQSPEPPPKPANHPVDIDPTNPY